MIEILAWIIFGALAGWIASLLMGTNAEQGALANIVVGMVGAFVGGLVMRALGSQGVTGINISSLFVSVLGAVLLLSVYKLVIRNE